MPGAIGLAVIGVAVLLASPANAQSIVKTCVGMEVRSIGVSVEPQADGRLDVVPETIELLAEETSATPSRGGGKPVTIVAHGPILGSMDSPEVKTALACTPNGFRLTAMITRSAGFHGAALQNVNWRPKITIAFAGRQPEIVFQAVWRMRLSTGIELDHAQTPPYPNEKYPIIIAKTVQSALIH
ncbi:MAG: hypothetical protein ACR2I2_23490 [Bryobacteraceae bacterium]